MKNIYPHFVCVKAMLFYCINPYLFTFFMVVSPLALTQAQDSLLAQKISLELVNHSIVEAFDLIESETGLNFAYSSDFIPDKRISHQFTDEKISKILVKLFAGTRLTYLLQGNQVVIYLDREKRIMQSLSKVLKKTIHGYIRDSNTGEELIGASVLVASSKEGSGTNIYGFYSLTLVPDRYRFIVRYIGYEPIDTTFQLDRDVQLDFNLKEASVELQQVIVTAEDGEALFGNNGLGIAGMNINDLNQIPTLFGEQDLIQGLQMLPGVTAAGGTGGDISVRGGGSDQNLILLDGAPIYNASHMLGIFSIFNPDALKQVKLYKGRIPTEYRGRLSSVLDIQMREGNMNKLQADGGIGLLSSRLKVEGPIVKNKSSFMLAGRRSYWDLIIKALAGDITSTTGLSYYDFNTKINYKFGKRDRVYLSGYFGRDRFRISDQNGVDWGNRTGTLRWNHLVSDQVFMHTSFIFSDYRYSSVTDIGELDLDLEDNNDLIDDLNSIQTRIRDYNLKVNFQFYPDPNHSFKFGGISIFHHFIPAQLIEEGKKNEPNINRNALENSLFANHEWQINDRLNLDYGLHFSHLATLGTNSYDYEFDDFGNLLDSTYFREGEVLKSYFRVEPRFSASYLLGENKQQELGFSFNRTYQYLQRISSSFANNPSRVWLPSSNYIKPQRADQLSIGYRLDFGGGKYRFSSEIYYKIMQNRINFRDGAVIDDASRYVEGLLVFGKETSTGIEFLLQKKQGRFRGWLSYTLSSNRGQYNQIDQGKAFPLQFDRTHDLAIVGILDIGRKCTLSANWVYYTGSAVSLPNGKYEIDGQIIDFYNQRNSYRLAPHQRLDLALTLYRKGKRKKETSWNFAVSNVYMHKNPFFVFIDKQDDSRVRELYLFRIVPSVTYNFKF